MSVTIDSAASGSKAPPVASGPKIAENLAENMVKLRSLAEAVADESGKTSASAKYDAYVQVRRMGVNGQFYGSGAEGQALLNKVAYSELGKKIYDLQAGYTSAVAAQNESDRRGLGVVMVDIFDSHSAEEQQILFDSVISPHLKGNIRRYENVASWKDNVAAQSQLKEYMSEAKGSSSAKSDTKFAQAERLWKTENNTTASWTSLVLQLFGNTSSTKLDLSDTAQKIVGDLSPAVRTGPYETGSVASMRI